MYVCMYYVNALYNNTAVTIYCYYCYSELDIFEEMLSTDKSPSVVLTDSAKPAAE